MFVEIRSSCQVAVGPVFVGSVGGAAVVLLIGRGPLVLVGAAFDVTAVVFRHLQKSNGGLEISLYSLFFFLIYFLFKRNLQH